MRVSYSRRFGGHNRDTKPAEQARDHGANARSEERRTALRPNHALLGERSRPGRRPIPVDHSRSHQLIVPKWKPAAHSEGTVGHPGTVHLAPRTGSLETVATRRISEPSLPAMPPRTGLRKKCQVCSTSGSRPKAAHHSAWSPTNAYGRDLAVTARMVEWRHRARSVSRPTQPLP